MSSSKQAGGRPATIWVSVAAAARRHRLFRSPSDLVALLEEQAPHAILRLGAPRHDRIDIQALDAYVESRRLDKLKGRRA